MKDLAKTLYGISKKLLETELGSTSGKVNLLGGIILVLLIAAIFIENIISKIINGILSYLDKPLIPTFGATEVLVSVFFVGLYFYLCVSTINSLKGSKGK